MCGSAGLTGHRFIRWRVGLMERGVQKLKLNEATEPIPDYGCGEDPYQGMQVHDYLSVHFFVQDKCSYPLPIHLPSPPNHLPHPLTPQQTPKQPRAP